MRTRVYRPPVRFVLWLFAVGMGLFAFAMFVIPIVNLVTGGEFILPIAWLGAAMIGGFAYFFPRMARLLLTADESGVTVVDYFQKYQLAWREIDRFEVGDASWGMHLYPCDGRVITVGAVQKWNLATWLDVRTEADRIVLELNEELDYQRKIAGPISLSESRVVEPTGDVRMTDVRIVKAGAERVDELEPLWKALQSHHHDIEGHIPGIPLLDLDTSWERRRANYVAWLAEPDAFVLIAEDAGGSPVGHALLSVHSADDTHVTRGRIAELESLSVVPELRGSGLGSRLLEAVFEEVRGLGIREMVIGVLAANTDAARLYERYGFRPWVVKYMGVVPGAPSSADESG